MEDILKNIALALDTVRMETYPNVVYQVRCDSIEQKEALKALLKQGNCNEYHTVVEIDFVGDSSAPKRGNKHKRRCGAEEFVFGCAHPRITVRNSPIYVFGRYIKMSREMCQTPLTIKGVQKTARNVSDFASGFETFFGAASVKFMGCGREDIDVRCLEGRPFVLEIDSPTRNLTAEAITLGMYSEVDVLDCAIVRRECRDYVNCETPTKRYNLLLYSEEEIRFERKYEVEQKTPLRVLHRRANMTRSKVIEVERVEAVEKEGFYYVVDIRAESGAYIKEWVTGDFGRTVPTLGGDLLELDVIGVDLAIPAEFVLRGLTVTKTRL